MGGMISKDMDAVETGMANVHFSVPHAEPAIIGKSLRIGVGIPNSRRPTHCRIITQGHSQVAQIPETLPPQGPAGRAAGRLGGVIVPLLTAVMLCMGLTLRLRVILSKCGTPAPESLERSDPRGAGPVRFCPADR
jgi:hypothetical protein